MAARGLFAAVPPGVDAPSCRCLNAFCDAGMAEGRKECHLLFVAFAQASRRVYPGGPHGGDKAARYPTRNL
jgi:hypothetical protein